MLQNVVFSIKKYKIPPPHAPPPSEPAALWPPILKSWVRQWP